MKVDNLDALIKGDGKDGVIVHTVLCSGCSETVCVMIANVVGLQRLSISFCSCLLSAASVGHEFLDNRLKKKV